MCQEVCPFNRKPSAAETAQNLNPSLPDSSSLDPTLKTTWLELLRETDSEYTERVNGTALERIRPEEFSRNLALALSEALSCTRDWNAEDAAALLKECQARLGHAQTTDAHALLWQACVGQLRAHLSRDPKKRDSD